MTRGQFSTGKQVLSYIRGVSKPWPVDQIQPTDTVLDSLRAENGFYIFVWLGEKNSKE